MKNRILKFIPLVTVVGVIAFWQVVSWVINAEIILPNPFQAFGKLFAFFGQKSFYSVVFGSLLRIIITFLVALVFAIICSILSSLSKSCEKALSVITLIFRAVPTMSIIFLCVIWFNTSIRPVVVCFIIVFPMLYVNILSQIKGRDSEIIEMSTAFQVPFFVQLKRYYLPTVISKSFDDVVATLSFSIKLMISAEAICRTRKSLGFVMTISKEGLETTELFAYTIACVILSFALELSCRLIKFLIRRSRYGRS